MSAPKLHLYALQGACSLTPHILLNESGLDFDKTVFSVAEVKKNHRFPEELYKLNPKGKVPTLVTDGEVITENPAIFTYISQLAPSNNFLGKTPLETVRVYEWLNYLAGSVHLVGYGPFFRPGRFTDVADGSLDKHVVAASKVLIREAYKYIDEKLEGKKWAVGDDYTAVDPYLYVFYTWGQGPAQFDMEQDFPNYARHAKLVAERPATQAALKAEGLL